MEGPWVLCVWVVPRTNYGIEAGFRPRSTPKGYQETKERNFSVMEFPSVAYFKYESRAYVVGP